MSKKQKVFVALSGGVDSSVSAALLKEQGYDVTGVYFKTYKPDGDRTYCRAQGQDAQKVAETLGIPFRVYDLESDYKREVYDYMIHEYRAGHTPNPDMICNARIKFGVFAQRAFADGAEYVATGHYAQKEYDETSKTWRLVMSTDEQKDQTYFLSQLTQTQLARTLFPVGHLTKPAVRNEARKFGLHTAEKKDSQGICFIGHEIAVKDFLRTHVGMHPGEVLNLQGETIGTHDGALLYTIGEHHGFTIDPQHQTPQMERLFVTSKDAAANTITVGTRTEFQQQNKALLLTIGDVNWIAVPPEEGKSYMCRIRHRGTLYPCTLTREARGMWIVHFSEPPYAPAAGQFLAIYDERVCLGGGVMQDE